MLIDNTILIAGMIFFQTLVLIAGVCYYFYKNKSKKEKYIEPVIEIEKLPNDRKGFGYLSNKALILNEHGVPYLYKTYNEAKRRMKNVRSAERIVHQVWDMETQTVMVSEVRHGTNQRQTSK
jgi:hypothetical protein